MKSIFYTGLFIVIAILNNSCNQDNQTMNTTTDNTKTKEKVFHVKTQKIESQVLMRTITYPANLEAYKEVYLAPSSPGRIKKIHVEVGDRIRKGQVLVEMDPTQLQQARTQLENAKSNFQRIDTLFQLNSISEQQYEQAKTQYELAKSNVQFLEENTRLLAPFNGVVTGKHYEGDEIYSGAPNTQTGKSAILTLIQINPLKATVFISQNFFSSINKGMAVNLSSDIFPNQKLRGKINKIYPTINPASRSFKTESYIENPHEKIRPGMYAELEIELFEAETLVVPAISVLKQEGTNNRYIFINENGTARRLDVNIGERFDDQVEIIANGVQEGLDLIVEGQANLLDGSKLNVLN